MEKIYYQLILAGRKTIDEVPDSIRANVQKLLDVKNENNAE